MGCWLDRSLTRQVHVLPGMVANIPCPAMAAGAPLAARIHCCVISHMLAEECRRLAQVAHVPRICPVTAHNVRSFTVVDPEACPCYKSHSCLCMPLLTGSNLQELLHNAQLLVCRPLGCPLLRSKHNIKQW